MTASFFPFFIISFLIIIHELGHTFMAYLLGIKIEKIYIYPLGGISKFNMPLNISIIKELLILIFGPLFQMIAYFILISIFSKDKDIIRIYNYSILFFNLLPIYPLDGGKILSLFIELFLPYKYSLILVVYISYFLVSIIVLNIDLKINIIIMVCLLVILITKEKKKISIKYNKFILERYLNNYKFKNKRIINNINCFYRNNKHIIKDGDNYYLEEDFLGKKYDKMH